MFVSFNWLKEYVDLSEINPEELADKFTLGGLEVELTTDLGKELDHLVVGKILSVEAVEGSEHLKKTKVDLGDQVLPIVCGAPNCKSRAKSNRSRSRCYPTRGFCDPINRNYGL